MPMPATAMPVGVMYQGSSTTTGGGADGMTWGGLTSSEGGTTATVEGLTDLRAARVPGLTVVLGAAIGETELMKR